uniref:ELM2 domain-containing protein n=1 Tax=Euplotes harpa TaxID=151035 RepID=A0A7S3JBS3_9SPIT|mmetsp:Transcript_26604/g.30741  ORF Transcript_26604/g.30741 Transcript_26604/m.30741 type:complete len:137 (+) Transcript_26604:91-501(+)
MRPLVLLSISIGLSLHLFVMEPNDEDKSMWMKTKDKPEIRVGKDFQATLPDCTKPRATEETKQPEVGEPGAYLNTLHTNVRIGHNFQADIPSIQTSEPALPPYLSNEPHGTKRDHLDADSDNSEEYREIKRQKESE